MLSFTPLRLKRLFWIDFSVRGKWGWVGTKYLSNQIILREGYMQWSCVKAMLSQWHSLRPELKKRMETNSERIKQKDNREWYSGSCYYLVIGNKLFSYSRDVPMPQHSLVLYICLNTSNKRVIPLNVNKLKLTIWCTVSTTVFSEIKSPKAFSA